ncbi:hypothetical protein [Geodermatophilus sp. SYSU D01119]
MRDDPGPAAPREPHRPHRDHVLGLVVAGGRRPPRHGPRGRSEDVTRL